MMSIPAHKNVTHPAGQIQNPIVLADYINRYDPLTGDSRRAEVPTHKEALRGLMNAVDNYERAEDRLRLDRSTAASANLVGCRRRLAEARRVAAESVSQ